MEIKIDNIPIKDYGTPYSRTTYTTEYIVKRGDLDEHSR